MISRSIGVAAIVWLGSSLAFADGSVVNEDRESRARTYFERGTADFNAGHYVEARASFSAGYELSHRSLFLFNMAECSRLDGNLAVAKESYERYLREAPAGSQAALARQRLAALDDTGSFAGGAPSPRKPRPAEPRAAPAPEPRPTKPRITEGGYRPVETLEPATRHDPLTSTPAASVSSPPACPGGDCTDDSAGRVERIAGVGIVGAGVALLATSAYYWHRSSDLDAQITTRCASHCDWDATLKDLDASRTSATHSQWVTLGVGGAAVIAGGVTYWLGARATAATRVSIAPRPEGGGSLTLSGSW